MQRFVGYISSLCVVFVIMVYCDWYCTFILCNDNANASGVDSIYSLYMWNYNDNGDVIIGQSFGVNKDCDHAIMHVRFMRNGQDEIYFDLVDRNENVSIRKLLISGVTYKVRHNGKAFKVIKGNVLINKLCEVDTFSVLYGNEMFKFTTGKLKRN